MKLISVQDNHYIIQHPDGSVLKVSKTGLSNNIQDKILMLAEGGIIPDKGFIPIPMGPVPSTVPVNVKANPPVAQFQNVRKATKEELDEPATFAPGTSDIYRTASDQLRPMKQPYQEPTVPETYQGGAVESDISPLDFPVEAAMLAKAGAKGLVRGALAGREAVYKAVPRLASEVGAVGGQKVAPRINPLGMYSKLEQTLEEKMGGSATPEQIKGMLRDVKPEEMQYSGLNQFLEGKNKVSKQEILDFVKANELPVQEKIISSEPILNKLTSEQIKRWNYLNTTEELTYKEKQEFNDLLNIIKPHGEPKFSQYTLPGGENYREKLYTLPTEKKQLEKQWQELETKSSEVANKLNSRELRGVITGEERAKLKIENENLFQQRQELAEKINSLKKNSYKSSHWDTPNVLAHTRLNDRIDDEGRKHLFVEEIQSDWHQAGRKQGYKGSEKFDLPYPDKFVPEDISVKVTPYSYEVSSSKYPNVNFKTNVGKGVVSSEEEAKEYAARYFNNQAESTNIAAKRVQSEHFEKSVPDAPMKKTWHEFVSKNLLSDAAKGGYDNISWTTGTQQALRYPGIAEQVNSIEHFTKGETKHLLIDAKSGKEINLELNKNTGQVISGPSNLIGKNLDEIIGKEPAQKIVESNEGVLKGNDLIMGGEGMKGFYDKMIPDYMAKIGKKYGVKPEKTEIKTLSGIKSKDFAPLNVEAEDEEMGVLKKWRLNDPEKYGEEYVELEEYKNDYGGKSYQVNISGNAEFLDNHIVPSIEKLNKLLDANKKEQVWTMKITPEMRKDILEKGLPLYSVGGVVASGMLNSKEAEAKPMNYKMLENKKDFYVMQHPDGSTFKVAKKGLKPEVMKKIEGFADFVQRAEGQIPGVDMPEQTASYMPEQLKEPDFAQMAMANPRTPQDDINQQIGQAKQSIQDQLFRQYAKSGIPEDYTPERIQGMAEEQVLGQRERQALAEKNKQFLAKEEEQRKAQEILAYNERAAKVGMPLRDMPGQKQETPLEVAAKKEDITQDVSQIKAQQPSEVDPFDLYAKGIKSETAAKAEGARKQAEIFNKLQTDIKNGDELYNTKLKSMYEQSDKLQKAAESKTVNPNQYWTNAGIPNKISASIGLILGGIGAGLTGTENAALKIIDKTIDNDIEAQKKNIDQANNLYKMNLDAIKDEKEAYNLTKAQMISLAEMKLKEQMANTSSKEAIAAGQVALAKLGLTKQTLLQQNALTSVMKEAQDNPNLITPEILQRMPAEDRERFVPGYGFTVSKTGAEKIRTELLPQKDTSVQMIDDLINIRQKYGRELTNRDVVNQANTLRSFLRGQMRTFLVGPGAVTENEQKILDQVIADPTKIITTDSGTLAALNTLKDSINKSFNNQAKANGLMVKQDMQAQGQQPVKGADGKFYIKQGAYWVPVK